MFREYTRRGNGIVPTTGDSLVDATASAKTNAPPLSNERHRIVLAKYHGGGNDETRKPLERFCYGINVSKIKHARTKHFVSNVYKHCSWSKHRDKFSLLARTGSGLFSRPCTIAAFLGQFLAIKKNKIYSEDILQLYIGHLKEHFIASEDSNLGNFCLRNKISKINMQQSFSN